MKIKESKSYLNLWKDIKDVGFTIEKISRFDFHDMEYGKALQFLDWLENNFVLYQYKNKTREQYNKHELFFWSNWNFENLGHFTISFSDNISFEKWDIITEQIIDYIKNNHSDTEGEIYLHYKNCIDYDKVNNYILNTDFNINNLPLKELSAIESNCKNKLLLEENKNKLYQLEQEFLKSLIGKKVVFNGMKGTIKDLGDYYGFFKQRATKTYYNIGFQYIKEFFIS